MRMQTHRSHARRPGDAPCQAAATHERSGRWFIGWCFARMRAHLWSTTIQTRAQRNSSLCSTQRRHTHANHAASAIMLEQGCVANCNP
jgi:hypothetical protein